MRYCRKSVFCCFCALAATNVAAAPFEGCLSNAFMTQESAAHLYDVNLDTGNYQLLSDDLGTTKKIDAIGFNDFDHYLYGFSSQWRTLVRIDNSYTATALSVSGLPNTNFYVGDVSLQSNTYFAYRKGTAFGLYRIELDAGHSEYLSAQRIINGNDLKLDINDFAFHPTDGFLYAVDMHGELHRINSVTGASEALGNVGELGPFGAMFFDAEGYLYFSRNPNGDIFRVDVAAQIPVASFFTDGPSSGTSDGARCGIASITGDSVELDFGNAPTSYDSVTGLAAASHYVSSTIQLGQNWGEPPDSATFISGFETGLDSILLLDVVGSGYINAWVDWDGDGSFDASEQVVSNDAATTGIKLIRVPVPEDAEQGDTWIRFRYSTTAGVGPLGNAANGEVEDYPISVSLESLTRTDYPSAAGYATVAYEDNWPVIGDYDMNDVVVAMRTSKFVNDDSLVRRYAIEGKVLALGASYHNGFAILMDGISTGNVDVDRSQYSINGVTQSASFLESNDAQDDAVLIISDDLKVALPLSSDCTYYRTEEHCQSFEGNDEFNFNLSLVLTEGVDESLAPDGVFNPFIFAAPNTYHGDVFEQAPGRSLEIHLKNKNVSSRFDTGFFGLADDNSNGIDTFVTSDYLPWALQVPVLWSHPREYIDISISYPEFFNFVETQGSESGTWYLLEEANSHTVINNNE